MSDIGTAVVTSFVSAITLSLMFTAFWSRQASDLRTELKGDYAGIRSEFTGLRAEFAGLRTEFAGLRTELKGDISELRTELRGDIQDLDARFDRLMLELPHYFRAGGHRPPPEAA